jgi:hypothetical protein
MISKLWAYQSQKSRDQGNGLLTRSFLTTIGIMITEREARYSESPKSGVRMRMRTSVYCFILVIYDWAAILWCISSLLTRSFLTTIRIMITEREARYSQSPKSGVRMRMRTSVYCFILVIYDWAAILWCISLYNVASRFNNCFLIKCSLIFLAVIETLWIVNFSADENSLTTTVLVLNWKRGAVQSLLILSFQYIFPL